MKNRDRMDIIRRILETANGGSGATRTKIMYNVFLSHGQLKQYLTILADKDLLRYDFLTQTFKTTEKGLRFIEIYNKIDDEMKPQI